MISKEAASSSFNKLKDTFVEKSFLQLFDASYDNYYNY